MPLNRYLIRNEYNLADPELYKSADKDDPEALLEGVAMAGLVGVLRQLGDLAEFAAEIFHDLHEEVMATASRGHDLIVRVQQLEAELPPVEKSLLSQTNHTAFLYNPGFDWHSKVHMDESLVTQGDLPRFVMDNYEECRGPPRLFLLDKFDVAGAGACLKRYTDPSFVKIESVDSNTQKPEGQREKRTRKVKRRGTRWKIGDTPVVVPSSHAKLHQLLLEERIETGAHDPERRVKLKKRALDRYECNEESRKSYMKKFLDTCQPVHRVIHEISMDLVPLSSEANISGHSGLEIVQYDALSPCEEPLERDKLAYPPCNFPEVEKYSINAFNEMTNSKFLDVREENHEDDYDKSLLMLSREMEEEEESAAMDSSRKSGCSVGEYHSDMASETDNFMDALATIDSNMDADTLSRIQRESLNLKISHLDSDESEEQRGPQTALLDYHSVGNSTVSDNGSMLNKETDSSCHDTVSYVAESVQESDGYVAATSSVLADQPSDCQKMSLVTRNYQRDDHVSADTSENLDERLAVKQELDGRSSVKRRRGFAKTELKWVKRSNEVLHKNSMTSSISSTEDELHMPDGLLSLSRTDAVKDNSIPNLFERVKNSSSSVSSYSEELIGVVGVNRASVSSPNNSEPAPGDLKDVRMPSPEEQSQSLSPLVDLAQKSGNTETSISGVEDAHLCSRLDVPEKTILCCGGDPSITSVSNVNDGEVMDDSWASTHADEGETVELRTCLPTDGPGVVGIPVADHTEMQSLGGPNYSKECMVETKANKMSKVVCLEDGEGDSNEPAHLLVSRVGSEATPEKVDVPVLFEHQTAETDGPNIQNKEEMYQELVVEEAESTLSTESTESSSASPVTETILREDAIVSTDEFDGKEVMNAGDKLPISPSLQSISSLSALEEEKPLSLNQTALTNMCVEAVVATTKDDDITDEKAVAVPLPFMMDQPASSHLQLHREGSPCVEVRSCQKEEVSQTLPLKPGTELAVQDLVSHITDDSYKLEQSAPNPFSAQDRQDSFHTADGTDVDTITESALNSNQVKEPQGGKLMAEHSEYLDHTELSVANISAHSTNLDPQSQHLEAQMVMPPTSAFSQNQPSVSTFFGQTDDSRSKSPPAIMPSNSITPPTSMLPDQIQPSQNPSQLITPLFPPDSNLIKLDEMPPPPPLPPMQWRLGKIQQHVSSGVLKSASGLSAALLQTDNNHDLRSQDSMGSQSWNPFSSYSREDLQTKHSGDDLERSFDLEFLDKVHDQSEQNMLKITQLLDSQSLAACQDDHQLGGESAENELFIEVASEHTSASGGVIKEEIAVYDEKLQFASSAAEHEVTDASTKEKVVKPVTDVLYEKSPVMLSVDELEKVVLCVQAEHISLVTEQGTVNSSNQFKPEIGAPGEKLELASSAIDQERAIESSSEYADLSDGEKVIKPERHVQDESLPNISTAGEEQAVFNEQLEHLSLVTGQEMLGKIAVEDEKPQLVSSEVMQERTTEAASEHGDASEVEVIMPEIDVQDEKSQIASCEAVQERVIETSSEPTDASDVEAIMPEIDVQNQVEKPQIAPSEDVQEKVIEASSERTGASDVQVRMTELDVQNQDEKPQLASDEAEVVQEKAIERCTTMPEIDVQEGKPQLPSSVVEHERAIEAASEHIDVEVVLPEIDVQNEKIPDMSAVSDQEQAVCDEQLEHFSLVTEQGTGNLSSQFKELAVQDEKLEFVSSEAVHEMDIEAPSEHTDACHWEKVIMPEKDFPVEKLPDIFAAGEQESVILDEQCKHVSSVAEQGTVNPSSQSERATAVQDEKLKHTPSAVELERATEASSKPTDVSNAEKVIIPEPDVQADKFSGVCPAGEQERVIFDEQLELVSSAIVQGNVNNPSCLSKAPLIAQQGHPPQPGFIAPEDQEAWSTNAFATVEPGNGIGRLQKKAPRPRNPLIDAVVAVDRSKLRKVGEIAKSQEKSRAKEREQNLPQLRKVGERVKPRDGSKTEENIRNLPRLRKVEERSKPRSEGKEISLPQLRKVGDKVKSPGEAKSEAREQTLPQLRKVGGRIKHQDKMRSEEREQSLPRLRKVGERVSEPQDELKSEEEKKQRLPALRKVGERGETQSESTSEQREQTLPSLPKVGERIKQQAGPSAEDRDTLMEQIRSKTFNLKPAIATRTSIPGPQTNLKVAAILQKANIIRQAMAGSDEEDSDGWSDN